MISTKRLLPITLIAIMALAIVSCAGLVSAQTGTVTTLKGPATGTVGKPITLTGSVKTTTGGAVTDGKVVVRYWGPAGGTITASGPLSGFSATFTPSAAGTYSVQANYVSETGKYEGSQSALLTITVTSTPTVTPTKQIMVPVYYELGTEASETHIWAGVVVLQPHAGETYAASYDVVSIISVLKFFPTMTLSLESKAGKTWNPDSPLGGLVYGRLINPVSILTDPNIKNLQSGQSILELEMGSAPT